MKFKHKVCIVTGGNSGIGKATAMQLAREGGKVVSLARNEESGKKVEKEIADGGGQAFFISADIGVTENIEAIVSSILEKWNRLDVLVNNAAMMTFEPITELSEKNWDKLMSVNLKSAFMFCKLCIPHMKSGAIVNVSSVHAHDTTANVIPYAASKGALEAFTRGVSREYDISQVRINCVAPGAVDTPMLWSNPNIQSGQEKIEGNIGKPEDIAEAICYLASEQAKYVNGTMLVVDGGRLNVL